MEFSELFQVSVVAKLLGVSPSTIRNWDREGKIESIRTLGGHRRFPMSEIERLRKNRRSGPDA
jgi:putative resolvase